MLTSEQTAGESFRYRLFTERHAQRAQVLRTPRGVRSSIGRTPEAPPVIRCHAPEATLTREEHEHPNMPVVTEPTSARTNNPKVIDWHRDRRRLMLSRSMSTRSRRPANVCHAGRPTQIPLHDLVHSQIPSTD